jgi:hypothetical protein
LSTLYWSPSISNILLIYFYDTKAFQILYKAYHKLNGEDNGFISLLTKVFNIFSCDYVKNCLKILCVLLLFWSTLPCFHQKGCLNQMCSNMLYKKLSPILICFSLLIINVKIFPILKMNDAHLIKKNDVWKKITLKIWIL